MAHIHRNVAKYVEMLKHPKAGKRYEACEYLRNIPMITPEALAALNLAANDPDESVAKAAQRALNVHNAADVIPSAAISAEQGAGKGHARSHMHCMTIASLCLGILALLPFTYAPLFVFMTIFAPSSTWYFGWLLVIGFHVPLFAGLFFGSASTITARLARKDVTQKKPARVGTILGVSSVSLAILYLVFFILVAGFGGTYWMLVQPRYELLPHLFLPKFEEIGGWGKPGLPWEYTFGVSRDFSEEDARKVGNYYFENIYGEGDYVIGFYCSSEPGGYTFSPEYLLYEYKRSNKDSLPVISTPLHPSRPDQGISCK